MTRKLVETTVVFLALLLCARLVGAQVEVVAKYRASFPTPLTTDQKITLLRAVAAEVHGGLLVKHDGNNCNGYACDIICFSPTALFDVLQAEGEAALPSWNATTNPRGYACELVSGTIPLPPPPPVMPDYEQMLNALREQGNSIAETVNELATKVAKMDAEDRADSAALKAQLTAHDQNPSYFVKIFGNRYVQLVLAAVATYVTEHQLTK